MGDMADYYIEQEMCGYGETAPRITRASKWKMRGGQEIAIRDMTIDHLRNTLKMYEQGRLQLPSAWFNALSRELEHR